MDSIELVGAVVSGAGLIAGALKLLARDLARAIGKHGQQVADNTAALNRNSEALEAAAEPKAAPAPTIRRAGLMLAGLALLLPVAGCAGTPDPLIVQAMERHRTIWQEDSRPDLPEDLRAAREREFAAGIRYAQSGGR
jgi:hypothetical protein